MRRIVVLIALLFSIFGVFTTLFSQNSQFHPFITDSSRCTTCHMMFRITGTTAKYIVLSADSVDISTACVKCHLQKAATHPVWIKAPFQVPKDLRLTVNNEITCITCHNPHNSRYSNRPWQMRSFRQKLYEFMQRKKQFKTYFLRRNNAHRELCNGCHQRERYHRIW